MTGQAKIVVTAEDFAKSLKKVDWKLVKGDTRQTLHGKDPLAGLKRPILAFIDGGHSYETTRSDIEVYSPYVIPGGFLVIDDSANRFAYPWGYFSGIASVSKAVDHCLPPGTPNDQWEHIGAVVHNRIWRKKF